MPRSLYIVFHALVAAGFIFFLQVYGLKQSLETAVLWAVALGAAAAVLAWKQTGR